MHDLKLVRERPEALREALARRQALDAARPTLDRLETLEQERRALIAAVEARRAESNATSQEVAKRKRAGESADDLIARGRAVGDEIKAMDARRAAAEQELEARAVIQAIEAGEYAIDDDDVEEAEQAPPAGDA